MAYQTQEKRTIVQWRVRVLDRAGSVTHQTTTSDHFIAKSVFEAYELTLGTIELLKRDVGRRFVLVDSSHLPDGCRR